jgi:hypothetical protein
MLIRERRSVVVTIIRTLSLLVRESSPGLLRIVSVQFPNSNRLAKIDANVRVGGRLQAKTLVGNSVETIE